MALCLDLRELFLHHNPQDRAVGLDHALGAEGADVLHRLLRRGGNDAVAAVDLDALQGKERRLHGRPGRGGQLERAPGLGAIAGDQTSESLPIPTLWRLPFGPSAELRVRGRRVFES